MIIWEKLLNCNFGNFLEYFNRVHSCKTSSINLSEVFLWSRETGQRSWKTMNPSFQGFNTRASRDSRSMNKLNTRKCIYIKLEHTCHSLTFINDVFFSSCCDYSNKTDEPRSWNLWSGCIVIINEKAIDNACVMNSLCAVIAYLFSLSPCFHTFYVKKFRCYARRK